MSEDTSTSSNEQDLESGEPLKNIRIHWPPSKERKVRKPSISFSADNLKKLVGSPIERPRRLVKRGKSPVSISSSKTSPFYTLTPEKISKSFFSWVSQLVISFTVLVFCLYQIDRIGPDGNKDFYISLVSSIVGYFLNMGKEKLIKK